MKITFLVPYPHGSAPSQRFRFEQYLAILNKNHSIHYLSFYSTYFWRHLYSNPSTTVVATLVGFIKRTYHLLVSINSNLIFIHREITPIGPPVFEFLLAKILRKKIIFDFDDAIWINDGADSKMKWWLKARWKIGIISRWSWKISVGNEFLRSYALKHNPAVFISKTVVDTSYHKSLGYKDRDITVGWTGSHSTSKYLNKIESVLSFLANNFSIRILIISNKNPYFEHVSYEFRKWNSETEIEDLSEFDIGIMPLEMSPWEMGKCGFKLIQYGSIGIPSAASPVGVNSDIIEDGVNGFLAETDDEWVEKLSTLIENPKLRTEMGKRGREKVVAEYSVEANKEKWLALFEN